MRLYNRSYFFKKYEISMDLNGKKDWKEIYPKCHWWSSLHEEIVVDFFFLYRFLQFKINFTRAIYYFIMRQNNILNAFDKTWVRILTSESQKSSFHLTSTSKTSPSPMPQGPHPDRGCPWYLGFNASVIHCGQLVKVGESQRSMQATEGSQRYRGVKQRRNRNLRTEGNRQSKCERRFLSWF